MLTLLIKCHRQELTSRKAFTLKQLDYKVKFIFQDVIRVLQDNGSTRNVEVLCPFQQEYPVS